MVGPREVSGGCEKASQRVGFQVGAYDAARPFLFDPVLVCATYLGGGSVVRYRAAHRPGSRFKGSETESPS